ncbi:28682_t:CDS:2 [Dentiscutata erythropus]|uniref:28682_t:CDS:1 n=1 Tax=Dentiscutata erythropus TaxID=1348616 RepID=A0A9N9B036_9GLOM|nr:28682_t:CDS:2 [Dentiscutata erythropus]
MPRWHFIESNNRLIKQKTKGFYPNALKLCYTLPSNKYPIPNNYSLKTSQRRDKNQKTVQCKIEYKDEKPKFQIQYGTFFKYKIKLDILATTAATNYEKAINKTSQLSGILLFGL